MRHSSPGLPTYLPKAGGRASEPRREVGTRRPNVDPPTADRFDSRAGRGRTCSGSVRGRASAGVYMAITQSIRSGAPPCRRTDPLTP